jgi:nickel-dependent lactate racemase
MSDPGARLGNLSGNPTRNDVEEMGQLVRVDLALNVVLNSRKELLHALAGEPSEVMRRGVTLARRVFEVEVDSAADAVIASPGGHPKDINLYQAQKALSHAALCAKPGAPIVLAAACPDGTGSDTYERWVGERSSHQDVLDAFAREGFHVGPHKAFQISRDAAGRRVILVSGMRAERVRRLLLEPAESLQGAVDAVVAGLARQEHPAPGTGVPDIADAGTPVIAVMPFANATVPRLSPNPEDVEEEQRL